MEDKTVNMLAEKIDTAVTTLSSKLGVASDHFYPIFVKQQVISGYISLGWATLSAICVCILTYIALGMFKKKDTDEVGWPIFIAVLLIVTAVVQTYSGLLGVINPEYYALKEIAALIK